MQKFYNCNIFLLIEFLIKFQTIYITNSESIKFFIIINN